MAWFPVLPQDFSFSLVSQGFEDLVGYSIREMQCKDRKTPSDAGCYNVGMCHALMLDVFFECNEWCCFRCGEKLFHDSLFNVLRFIWFPTFHIIWALIILPWSSRYLTLCWTPLWSHPFPPWLFMGTHEELTRLISGDTLTAFLLEQLPSLMGRWGRTAALRDVESPSDNNHVALCLSVV